MSDSPHIIQRAASFDWETLLPIIFFVLYGVAQFFGSKKKGDAVEEEEMESGEDPMDRARQIREEIRRKIEERKQASEQTASPQESSYDPTQPEVRRPMAEPQPAAPAQRPVVVHQAQTVHTQGPGTSIEEQLAEQRKRLDEARRQHDAAMQQAREMTHSAGSHSGDSSGHHGAFASDELLGPAGLRNDLIRGLRDPNTIRKAVLYREVLGQPLGLR